MLRTLTVQDLVVVRTVDIEFGAGLTVLTGETGAGKSILVDALGLALGERADSRMVRSGCERASVTAVFDVQSEPEVRNLLATHELDTDDECVLRRVISKDGRSRAYCNSSPVAAQLLREIASCLVDVHAQHAGQRMLQRPVQRRLLDAYGGHDAETANVAAAHDAWQHATEALAALEGDGNERDRQELLRYQVEELDAARISGDEVANIEQEFKRLASGAENLEHCGALRQSLTEADGNASEALRIAKHHAQALMASDDRAKSLLELIEQSAIGVDEALRELEMLEASTAVDPGHLASLDQRLAELHGLARKHQVALSELPPLAERLQAELETHAEREAAITALQTRIDETLAHFDAEAQKLSSARNDAAARMNEDITERLRELGIPEAIFTVHVSHIDDAPPQVHGRDRVEFVATTNDGQPAGPLNKVASGGELSRIGLAIQAATARHAGVPVVVYDEVDTGIGGTTANIVGRSLRAVAGHTQVICITHSPQVASAGDAHLNVSKKKRDGIAETTISVLEGSEREAEIARMLGAAEATASSVAHARDLIEATSQTG